jgi:hypothetical protein
MSRRPGRFPLGQSFAALYANVNEEKSRACHAKSPRRAGKPGRCPGPNRELMVIAKHIRELGGMANRQQKTAETHKDSVGILFGA